MGKNPGGAQPLMRDTSWIDKDGKRREQKLVDDQGVAKGLKLVLQERGLGDPGSWALHPLLSLFSLLRAVQG